MAWEGGSGSGEGSPQQFGDLKGVRELASCTKKPLTCGQSVIRKKSSRIIAKVARCVWDIYS